MSCCTVHNDSASEVTVRGRIAQLATQPHAELTGEWQRLRWPLSGDAVVTSETGTFELDGDWRHYTARVQAAIGGGAIPHGVWTVAGSGTQERFPVAGVAGRGAHHGQRARRDA